MFSRRLLIAALSATFLFGLVILFPARLALAWFAPPGFQAAGVEGTVWNGRAAQAAMQGIYLAPLRWQFRPLALLSGGLGYQVAAEMPGGRVEAEIVLTLTGNLRLADLQASVPLASVSRLIPLAQAEGRLIADVERGLLEAGWPSELVGTMSLENLVYLPAGTSTIGNYRVEFFETNGEGLRGSLSDAGGPLEVTGEIVVGVERDYVLSGRVKARPGAPAALANSMRFLGSPDDSGRREFSLAGRL